MAITTKFFTWTEIWTKIKSELDIDDDDDFIDETEAMSYANDGVDEAEAEILEAYPDYFLTRGTITLVATTDEYVLPTTIYAHKIRGIVYYSGSNVYEVKRIRDWKKLISYRLARTNSSGSGDYGYFIHNSTAGSPKIAFSPIPYESGQVMEVWFIRQANRFTTGADPCDIPEFSSFVVDFLRERIEYKRAAGSPRHASALAKLEGTRGRMVDTLTTMVPDADNEIEPDMSSYDEHN